MSLERPILPLPRPGGMLAHFWPDNFANGIGAFLFAVIFLILSVFLVSQLGEETKFGPMQKMLGKMGGLGGLGGLPGMGGGKMPKLPKGMKGMFGR